MASTCSYCSGIGGDQLHHELGGLLLEVQNDCSPYPYPGGAKPGIPTD